MPRIVGEQNERDHNKTISVDQFRLNHTSMVDFLDTQHIFYIEITKNEESYEQRNVLKICRIADKAVVDTFDLPLDLNLQEHNYLIHRDVGSRVALLILDNGFYNLKLDSNWRILSSEFIMRDFEYTCATVDDGKIYYLEESEVDDDDVHYQIFVEGLRGEHHRRLLEWTCTVVEDIYVERDILFLFDIARLLIVDVKTSEQVYVEMNHINPYPDTIESLYNPTLECYVVFFRGNENYKCLILQKDLTYQIFETGIEVSDEESFNLITHNMFIVDGKVRVIKNFDFSSKSVLFACIDIPNECEDFIAIKENMIACAHYDDDDIYDEYSFVTTLYYE
ncbi:hypothetical protein PCE1_000466 [Barthelona sp. PCE]